MHSLANIRPEPLAPSDLLLETERLRLRLAYGHQDIPAFDVRREEWLGVVPVALR